MTGGPFCLEKKDRISRQIVENYWYITGLFQPEWSPNHGRLPFWKGCVVSTCMLNGLLFCSPRIVVSGIGQIERAATFFFSSSWGTNLISTIFELDTGSSCKKIKESGIRILVNQEQLIKRYIFVWEFQSKAHLLARDLAQTTHPKCPDPLSPSGSNLGVTPENAD